VSFAAAKESGAVLFFDEADALVGKRAGVHDSHDHYANIEINYLLKRIDEYADLVILATGKRTKIDNRIAPLFYCSALWRPRRARWNRERPLVKKRSWLGIASKPAPWILHLTSA
jgi:SpoVK/Ycf46/Vps4 family AAA+-type ATPase